MYNDNSNNNDNTNNNSTDESGCASWGGKQEGYTIIVRLVINNIITYYC